MEEIKKLSEREIVEVVMDMLETQFSLRKESYIDSDNLEHAEYYGEIYVDYRDELSEDRIQEILADKHPKEAFWELLNDWSIDAGDYEADYIYQEIRRNWDKEEHGDFEDVYDTVNEYLNEHLHFSYPEEHFLKQDVKLNIIIDNGDGDQDFTLNNIYSYNTDYEEPIDPEAGLVWLVEQQGYTIEDLEKARQGEYKDIPNRFLKTVIQEAHNVTTHMNALTFFVSMTLGEYFDYLDEPGDLVLSKNSRCGLYDSWQGAGSIHEIELEKDVVIPKSKMDIQVEGTVGYGVDQIYGVGRNYWLDTVIR